MKMLATAALMSGLLICAGAAPATAADTPKPPKEKKICHTEVALGSIMPKSICHTKAEWAAIDAANSENAHNVLSQPRGTEVQRP